MIYVYILQSQKDLGFYIGICKDLDIRLKRHNKGGVTSTKRRRPFKMIYKEEFSTYRDARKREKEIKGYKGGIQFKELIKYCRVV